MASSIRMHEIATALAPLATLPLLGTLIYFAERARTRRANPSGADPRMMSGRVRIHCAPSEDTRAINFST